MTTFVIVAAVSGILFIHHMDVHLPPHNPVWLNHVYIHGN